MGRRYADELTELAQTYRTMRALGKESVSEVASSQMEFNRRDAQFVGSGGAIAMAQLAASVHSLSSTHMSRAVTPLNLAIGRGMRVTNTTVGLFSARARHPDVRLAARSARAQPGNRVVLFTQLDPEEVAPELAAVVDQIVTLPRNTRDGFLATNSIVAMATTWLLAAGFELPETLPMLEAALPPWPEGATRALVLYGPDQVAAAYDLEARLSETGLLDVQLADLRNVAHGRHVGLLAKAESTTVIALGDPGSQALVERTLSALPAAIRVVDLSTSVEGPTGTLDTLVGCMRLIGEIGSSQGVDPGQPRVSLVGRRLYHLPWSRLAARPDGLRPARVKAVAAGMTASNPADLAAWTDAWKAWSAGVAGRRVGALVLDHDGTCVPTASRTSPPPQAVQSEVIRLLEQGVRVALASGRGPSILEELRRWVPREHWEDVVVGIYNGGVIRKLSEDVERGTSASDELLAAAKLLRIGLVGEGWQVTARRWQVTVERIGTSAADATAAVSAVLAPDFGPLLKVFESGHSVDVVPRLTSKRAVVDCLDIEPSEILLIGDQGEVGGNDFELLSYSDLSLSVDRVSADGTRCWNLSEEGASGPMLLVRYLQAVQVRGQDKRFVWASSKSRSAK